MTPLFTEQAQGIAVSLIPETDYDSWFANLATFSQNIVQSQQAKKRGFALLCDSEGRNTALVVFVDYEKDFFIAGDVATSIPAQHYVLDPDLDPAIAQRFAISWALSCYQFTRYKDATSELASLGIESTSVREQAEHFAQAIFLTRDLINTPASDMMPENLSEHMQALAQQFGGEFTEVVGDDLLTQNYPTIHAVGRASVHAPRLLDLRWGDQQAPKVTLVGKGVCFDSGGLNLKPGNFMRLMKKDMGGAAHVLGLARLIMAQNLPVQLRVMVPAVENAVSSNAFRPGDVITTRPGTTVEIDNTDAEGRLVLCDALSEADSENPEIIIDFATLTGACRVALGTEVPGFFTNNETVATELFARAVDQQDPIWRLPLHKPYTDMLKSQVADTLNSSASGMGGAITAALYLQKFVSDTQAWVHFDVMAWNDRKQPGRPIGGEAFGIRAVYEYLRAQFGA